MLGKERDGEEMSEVSAPVSTPQEPLIDKTQLPDYVGYNLRLAHIAVFQNFNRHFEPFDIRPTQYGVLSVIESNPGLKQSQISAALGIKRTNFVALLDGLEKRGLARRDSLEGDRRSYAVCLTDQGHELLAKLRAANAEHENLITSIMGEEGRNRFLTDLIKLTKGLRKARKI